MKPRSLPDLFAAATFARGRRSWPGMKPPTIYAKPMPTKQYDEGIVHYGSRAAYLEPPPKVGQRTVLDAHGKRVTEHFAIPQPWRRVTPKAVRPGQTRRRAA